MRHAPRFFLIAAGIAGMVGTCPLVSKQPAHAAESTAATSPDWGRDAGNATRRYMFHISLHTADEIRALLDRAEMLATTTPIADSSPGIALVLHGPEVKFFSRQNYGQYKSLVDQAARLDARRIIDIKICQTQMHSLGIRDADIPDFVDLVPYGPAEIERLERGGYVYL